MIGKNLYYLRLLFERKKTIAQLESNLGPVDYEKSALGTALLQALTYRA